MARHRYHGIHQRQSDGQLQRVLVACAVTAGWCVIAGTVASSVLERSGLLADWVETEVRLRLADDQVKVEVGSASIAWLQRTIVLREVTVHTQGSDPSAPSSTGKDLAPAALGGDPDVRLAELRLVLQLGSSAGLRLSQAGLRGGHVHVTPELLALARRLDERNAEVETKLNLDAIPYLRVEGVDVAWEIDRVPVPLGRASMAWLPGKKRVALWGRMDPAGVRSGESGLVLHGELDGEGSLDVRGRARNLVLDESLLPLGTPAAALRPFAPEGNLSLDVRAQHQIAGSELPGIELRLSLTDGGLRLPHVEPELADVQGLDLSLRIASVPGVDPLASPDEAWTGELSAALTHAGIELEAGARLGVSAGRAAGQDLLGEFWVHSPAIGLNDTTMALAASSPILVNLREMLLPEGTAAISYGMRAPRGWRPGPNALHGVANCAFVQANGDISLAYVGGRNRRAGGLRNVGFPRRVHRIHGRTAYTYLPGLDMQERLGFFGLSAETAAQAGGEQAGGITAHGGLFVRPAWLKPGWRPGDPYESEFHLEVGARGLPMDDELRAAFGGMGGVPGVAEAIPEYDPMGGLIDFDLRFFDPLGKDVALAMDLNMGLQGVGLSWAPCPLPVEDAHGRLRILTNGVLGPERGRGAVLFTADGASPGAEGPIRAAGRFAFHGEDTARSWASVEAERLQLRSQAVRDTLDVFSPEVADMLESTAIRGWVDLDLDFAKPYPDAEQVAFTTVTAAKQGLTGTPEAFPMDTQNVHGRILVKSIIPERSPLEPNRVLPATTTSRAELLGTWLSGPAAVPLALSIVQPNPDLTELGVRFAGLDVSNPTVTGALREAVARSEGTGGSAQSTSLGYSGHLDGIARLSLGPDPETPPLSTEIEVQARLDDLRFGDAQLLRDLHGKLTLSGEDEGWSGERLTAVLGETPVELENFTYAPVEGGDVLETEMRGIGLPLDEAHLRHFLDEDLLRTLLDDLEVSGVFDVEDGKLRLLVKDSGQSALEFNGELAVRDASVSLGVPVRVDQARGIRLSLGYEGGRVRALAQVEELNGALADRNLEEASFQMTYVEPRLTIEELTGAFEGGSLSSLGAGDTGAATFFAIDLAPPFDFALSADLSDVDAGRMLAGMFNSDFANEGLLDAQLQLSGAVDELTNIQGEGRVVLRDSALWAIPVFQSLFSQLGFDTTATFSRMESSYRIEEGRLALSRMRMKSDLLSLVGDGWIDFDGTMSQDMRVRYSLVDRLGPFTQLLYWIQNSLLRVSIRGDMARPKVLLKGLFSQFIKPPDPGRRLPLPGVSPLPKRF